MGEVRVRRMQNSYVGADWHVRAQVQARALWNLGS